MFPLHHRPMNILPWLQPFCNNLRTRGAGAGKSSPARTRIWHSPRLLGCVPKSSVNHSTRFYWCDARRWPA